MKKLFILCMVFLMVFTTIIGCTAETEDNPQQGTPVQDADSPSVNESTTEPIVDQESSSRNYMNTLFSVNGENEFIRVRNGLITITDELEQFFGGELVFLSEAPTDVKDYVAEFYYFSDGDMLTINRLEFQNAPFINTGLATSHSTDGKYISNLIDKILDSFHFRLRGTFNNGETFEYDIELSVVEITSDMLGDYRPMVYIQDKLYGQTADITPMLPESILLLGSVETVVPQNEPMPQVNGTSNDAPVGSDIFAPLDDSGIIWVQLTNGMYSIYEEIE